MKYRKIVTKPVKSTRWPLTALGVIWLAFLLLALFLVAYNAFRGVNQPLISPIEGISVVSPAYANEIKKEDSNWWRIYQRVRWLESNNGTKGLAVTCSKKGLINEIGYLPYKGYCFNNRAEQELTFSRWITKRLNAGMSEEEALRIYSGGAYGK